MSTFISRVLDVCLAVIRSFFTRIGFGSLGRLGHPCGSHMGYSLSHSTSPQVSLQAFSTGMTLCRFCFRGSFGS